MTGSEEQSDPNDRVVFFSALCSVGPDLFSFLVASRLVFVYMACDCGGFSSSHPFYCQVLLLGNRKYPLPKGRVLGHEDFTPLLAYACTERAVKKKQPNVLVLLLFSCEGLWYFPSSIPANQSP